MKKTKCKCENNPPDARFCIDCGAPRTPTTFFGTTIRMASTEIEAPPQPQSPTNPKAWFSFIDSETVRIFAFVIATTLSFILLMLMKQRGFILIFLINGGALVFTLLAIIDRLRKNQLPDLLLIIAALSGVASISLGPSKAAMSILGIALGLIALNCLLAHLFVPVKNQQP